MYVCTCRQCRRHQCMLPITPTNSNWAPHSPLFYTHFSFLNSHFFFCTKILFILLHTSFIHLSSFIHTSPFPPYSLFLFLCLKLPIYVRRGCILQTSNWDRLLIFLSFFILIFLIHPTNMNNEHSNILWTFFFKKIVFKT